jgi:hypothetical protein
MCLRYATGKWAICFLLRPSLYMLCFSVHVSKIYHRNLKTVMLAVGISKIFVLVMYVSSIHLVREYFFSLKELHIE